MAETNTRYKALFNENMEYETYYKFMEEIYSYIRPREVYYAEHRRNTKKLLGIEIPPSFEIYSENTFINGVLKYASNKGVNLKPVSINMNDRRQRLLDFIKTGLSKDRPITLLNPLANVKMSYLSPIAKKEKIVDYRLH